MNITISSNNVAKVISVATAIYWAIAGWVLWSDKRTGDWMEKGGLWIILLIYTALCGLGFWGMLGPVAFQAAKANWRPLSARKIAKTLWCLSTLPMVLICLSFYMALVYRRMSES
ncbi:hypothetical protein [Luteolibacter luteus]|uniref:Uncharacterized protein n=1 Tax=Luteolibacter luteus TaxID=2728835 RepID=A0A858RR04_9BACT|nr:hypothetical protein [Luteolibacter luteus]QJE98964.1 hypothetical protein HHL09_25355 [Luteolibacter luteus]